MAAGVRAWAMMPLNALVRARGLLFPFVPVLLAFGIGLWFALPFEPGLLFYLATAAILLGLLVVWRFAPDAAHPVIVPRAALGRPLFSAGRYVFCIPPAMLQSPPIAP